MQKLAPTVKLGERVYNATNWTRQDDIFLGQRRIGIIKLSCGDRQGRTISLITHASKHGRSISWCVAQANQNAIKRRGHLCVPINI